MTNIDSLLESRLASSDSKDKMMKVRSLAEKSKSGQLSGFSTLLATTSLSQEDKDELLALLTHYNSKSNDPERLEKDFSLLSNVTQEIRSITQQSILLHGERVERAQKILSSYIDGAFSAWLLKVYGNRQTPYNFLLYYQLYSAVEESLKSRLEIMPKQAIYTLASRNAPLSDKIDMIKAYKGEKKQELLEEIRKRFPLETEDRRKGRSGIEQIHKQLELIQKIVQTKGKSFSSHEKVALRNHLKEIIDIIP